MEWRPSHVELRPGYKILDWWQTKYTVNPDTGFKEGSGKKDPTTNRRVALTEEEYKLVFAGSLQCINKEEIKEQYPAQAEYFEKLASQIIVKPSHLQPIVEKLHKSAHSKTFDAFFEPPTLEEYLRGTTTSEVEARPDKWITRICVTYKAVWHMKHWPGRKESPEDKSRPRKRAKHEEIKEAWEELPGRRTDDQKALLERLRPIEGNRKTINWVRAEFIIEPEDIIDLTVSN